MRVAHDDWPRLLALLDQALEMPAAEREGWLQRLDLTEALKTGVRSLLADRRAIETGDFLRALPAVALPPADAQGGHGGRLQPGTLIGPWRLLQPLGQGGMSTVWLAERADDQVQRQVALKLPHAGPGQELLAERLLRERNILAALEHPNIARLYDVGLTDAGTPYLVMEVVQGDTLLAHADARRMSLAQRLALFQQVLRAVQYAHSKLVLHRDLKPGNILVNAAGDVKLLDFGIARLLGDAAAGDSALTQHSGHLLTPDYAAPEQIAGQPLGIGCDIYALGVLLFELLTGERPYKLPRGSRGELEEAILAAEPRRPSEAWRGERSAEAFSSTPPALRRALQGDLDVIVSTALQKAPAARYHSADAYLHDIQRHLDRQPILARPGGRWYRAGKFAARNALALGAVGAVFAALGIGLGVAMWQGQQARLEAAKATAIKDFLIGLMGANDLDQDDAPRKRQQTVQQLLEQSAADLGGGLAGEPEVRSELQGVVGGLLDSLELLGPAISIRRLRADQLSASGAPVEAQVRALLELAESERGDLMAARTTLDRAVGLCEVAVVQQTTVCLVASLEKGRFELIDNRVSAAGRYIEPAAVALQRRAPGSRETAAAIRTLGELRDAQGRHDESYALLQEAFALNARLWGPRSSKLAAERELLANRLAMQLRLQQANAEREAAWQAMVAAAGPDDIKTAQYELELGLALSRVSAAAEGEGHVRRASRILLASTGPDRHRQVFNARRAMAGMLLNHGRLAEASQTMGQLEDASRSYALDAADSRDLDLLRARQLLDTGQFSSARRLLERRRDATLAQFDAGDRRVADLNRRIALVQIAEGDLAAAGRSVALVQAAADEREAATSTSKQLAGGIALAIQIARGEYAQAMPQARARFQLVSAKPREDQYLSTVLEATETMARVLQGLGRPAEARPYFEQAAGLLQPGYAHNPALAAARVRLAACLLELNEKALARQQLDQARAAFRAEPTAGPQFRQGLEALVNRLEKN